MNHKEIIINTVLQSVFQVTDDLNIIDRVRDSLEIALHGYNVEEAKTDLQIYDGGFISVLKKFIVCKEIGGASTKTLERYYQVNRRLLEGIGKPLQDITTDDIRLFMAHLRQSGKVSNLTLDGFRLCYSSFFTWATAEGFISVNPMLSVQKIKHKKQIKKAFSSVELEKIKKACNTQRDLALVQFLYATGVRVSECVSLDKSDIDFDNNELTVLGKGNKERKVYLSDVAAMHLKQYLASRSDHDDALFIGRKGRLTKCGIECLLRRISDKSGVPGVHPHRFRRTLATSLLNKGMDIVAVADLLGHSDIRTTQIYVSISQTSVKASYQKIIAA